MLIWSVKLEVSPLRGMLRVLELGKRSLGKAKHKGEGWEFWVANAISHDSIFPISRRHGWGSPWAADGDGDSGASDRQFNELVRDPGAIIDSILTSLDTPQSSSFCTSVGNLKPQKMADTPEDFWPQHWDMRCRTPSMWRTFEMPSNSSQRHFLQIYPSTSKSTMKFSHLGT